jgi:phenylalanyl-tRNA synthetase alpha chain
MTTQLSDLETQLVALKQEAQLAIATTSTLDDLEQLRIKYLGKKGSLSQVLGGMGQRSHSVRTRSEKSHAAIGANRSQTALRNP